MDADSEIEQESQVSEEYTVITIVYCVPLKMHVDLTHLLKNLTCSAIYPSRLFWCELLSFRDISYRDV